MLQIFKTKKVKTPTRTGKNAGFDFYVPDCFKEQTLLPMRNIVIPSGIKVRLPDNHVLIGFNKSGMSVKYGLHVGACVVDENYTGEIHLDIHNTSTQNFTIRPNMKLMQFVLLEQYYYDIKEVSSEQQLYKGFNIEERGEKGFGSSGI